MKYFSKQFIAFIGLGMGNNADDAANDYAAHAAKKRAVENTADVMADGQTNHADKQP
ncbi:MAG: hypothetical protein P8183_08770 [Anaerolineae bacterium]